MEIDYRAYSGAIYDIIKFKLGYSENFVLPNDIKNLIEPKYGKEKFIFGKAFTARGDKTKYPNIEIISEMVDEVDEGDVYILQANDNSRAHFGDIMAHFLKRNGAEGAILQGWTRDLGRIEYIGFPLWAKGVQPQDSSDIWSISSYLEEIVIGNIFITPRDYIFADRDAVLIIRDFLVLDLLAELPDKLDYEAEIRKEISTGTSAKEIYNEIGRW